MSESPKLYIAGIGMVTPLGANTEMTAAAVKAGMSAYKESEFYGLNDEALTMASIPEDIFSESNIVLGEGDRKNDRHDRISVMSSLAIQEACENNPVNQSIYLLLSEPEEKLDEDGLVPLIENIENNCRPWISTKKYQKIKSGRAAGIEAIELAFRYFDEIPDDYILIGGSDSYHDYSRLGNCIKNNRVLTESCLDGFTPGEAACFLLLTLKPENALEKDGFVIALNYPGVSSESGHLHSKTPYLGEGLDQAFKKALSNKNDIDCIFSSMNGESFWAKEFGVAYMRNHSSFTEQVEISHPADLFGDTGSATSSLLIALATDRLLKNNLSKSQLIYSSSDHELRGAILLEKVSLSIAESMEV